MMNYAAHDVNTFLDKSIHVDEAGLLAVIKQINKNSELYHCYYNLEPRETFKAYSGKMSLAFGLLHIDLDHVDIEPAFSDTKKISKKLTEEKINHRVYFSGNKGFHIAAPAESFGILGEFDKKEMESKVKTILQNLKTVYPTVDSGIWNANRKFRAYRSLNKKSGLYKVELNLSDLDNLTVDQIKIIAKTQPLPNYNPYLASNGKNEWAASFLTAIKSVEENPSMDQPTQENINRDSDIFENFEDKKCIKDMLKRTVPQFNRHDIGLRIINNCKKIGKNEKETTKIIKKWAENVFASDENCEKRVADVIRMVKEPTTYRFGCYDDVKKAYCTAKCKLYSKLDREKRAKVLDAPKTEYSGVPEVLKAPSFLEKYINGVQPLEIRISRRGTPIMPSEIVVASHVLEYYGDNIRRYEDDLFIYTGKHWKHLKIDDIYTIKTQIHVAYAGLATASKVESTLTVLKTLVKPIKQNLFAPNPYMINLNNGTLHVFKENSEWVIEFREHNYLDYAINIIPIDYDETGEVKNTEFEAMLDRIFEKDPHKDDKIKTIRQMYGACLAPIFPHLFLFYGKGGSGKSSVIIPAQRLVHVDNWSSVEPHEFEGFKMESMAGKLVNFVTDINVQEPIEDAHIKKIEDRMPVRIDRKFQTAILAPLPAVHVFGANENLKTYDKASGAHRRRWTILPMNTFDAELLVNYSKSFANDAFDSCPQGVLNFAIEGLKEILASNGHFHKSTASKEAMKSMEIENDRVAQFVDDIAEGSWDTVKFYPEDPTRSASRIEMWKEFSNWHDLSYHSKPRFGMRKFYEQFRKLTSEKFKVEEKKDVIFHFFRVEISSKNYSTQFEKTSK